MNFMSVKGRGHGIHNLFVFSVILLHLVILKANTIDLPEELIGKNKLLEAEIDWDSMSEAAKIARRQRKLGQCAEGCVASQWNVLKLIIDGSYMSIRRISQTCNLILPQGPVINNFVQARCGVNVPGQPETAPVYQVGDVLIGAVHQSDETPAAYEPLLGNNNIFAKTGTELPIGMSFQNCIMAQNDFSNSVPLNTFTCLWTLAFSDGMTNQIMAAGNYFNQTRSSDSRIQNPPKYQIIAITGGTGMFNRIKGFIILTPLDLKASPPKWWYYVVYKDVWI